MVAHAALEKQADDVVILDLRTLSTVTDFFVICTGGSTPQLRAVKDHIEATLHQHGCEVHHAEGTVSVGPSAGFQPRDPLWVLLDCGDLVVHVMDPHAREFYRLEDLWADAPRVMLPAASV